MLELLEDFSDSVQLNTTTSTITNQSSIIPGHLNYNCPQLFTNDISQEGCLGCLEKLILAHLGVLGVGKKLRN